MPRFTGKSSQGSNPMTVLSLTLSWMPHCTPQKQQCVFTSRSDDSRPCQPPGGVSWRWGPYCVMRCASVCGRAGMGTDLLLLLTDPFLTLCRHSRARRLRHRLAVPYAYLAPTAAWTDVHIVRHRPT